MEIPARRAFRPPDELYFSKQRADTQPYQFGITKIAAENPFALLALLAILQFALLPYASAYRGL